MAVHLKSRSPSIVYWLDETLYLNITNRCTNDCYFCIRKFKTGIAGFNLKLQNEPSPAEIINEIQAVINRKPWKEIVFCGFGEPTTRLDVLLEVARWIRDKTSKPIRVDTNGHSLLLYPERDVVKELKEADVKVSTSLNAHDEATYNEVCRPTFENAFEKVLEFIGRARDVGLSVEVTAVAIPEVEISRVAKIAHSMGVKFRARPYSPFVW